MYGRPPSRIRRRSTPAEKDEPLPVMTSARSDAGHGLGEGVQQLDVEGADPAVLDAQDGDVIPILGDQHRAIIHAAGCRAGQWEIRGIGLTRVCHCRHSGDATKRSVRFTEPMTPRPRGLPDLQHVS